MKKFNFLFRTTFLIFVSAAFFSCSNILELNQLKDSASISVALPEVSSRDAAPENVSFYKIAVLPAGTVEAKEYLTAVPDIYENQGSNGALWHDAVFAKYAVQSKAQAAPGDTIEFFEVNEGTYEVYVAAFTKDGIYIQSGYSSVEVKENETAAAAIVLKKIPVTVTFDSNTGDEKTTLQWNTYSNYYAELPENKFTKNYYAFAGWNTAADGSGISYSDKQSVLIADNITLYAQWAYVSQIENYDALTDFLLNNEKFATVVSSFAVEDEITNSNTSVSKTIDFNGNTINAAGNFKNSGNLTLKDSSAEKTGGITFASGYYITNGSNGDTAEDLKTLTIESGTYTVSAASGIVNYGKLNIKGGTISGTVSTTNNMDFVSSSGSGSLNMTGGTISAENGGTGNASAVVISGTGSLTVAGGTIIAKNTSSGGDAIGIWTNGNPSAVSVSGSSMTASNSGTGSLYGISCACSNTSITECNIKACATGAAANVYGINNSGTITLLSGGSVTAEFTSSSTSAGNVLGIYNKGTITELICNVSAAVTSDSSASVSGLICGIYNQGTVGSIGTETSSADSYTVSAQCLSTAATNKNCFALCSGKYDATEYDSSATLANIYGGTWTAKSKAAFDVAGTDGGNCSGLKNTGAITGKVYGGHYIADATEATVIHTPNIWNLGVIKTIESITAEASGASNIYGLYSSNSTATTAIEKITLCNIKATGTGASYVTHGFVNASGSMGEISGCTITSKNTNSASTGTVDGVLNNGTITTFSGNNINAMTAGTASVYGIYSSGTAKISVSGGNTEVSSTGTGTSVIAGIYASNSSSSSSSPALTVSGSPVIKVTRANGNEVYGISVASNTYANINMPEGTITAEITSHSAANINVYGIRDDGHITNLVFKEINAKVDSDTNTSSLGSVFGIYTSSSAVIDVIGTTSSSSSSYKVSTAYTGSAGNINSIALRNLGTVTAIYGGTYTGASSYASGTTIAGNTCGLFNCTGAEIGTITSGIFRYIGSGNNCGYGIYNYSDATITTITSCQATSYGGTAAANGSATIISE